MRACGGTCVQIHSARGLCVCVTKDVTQEVKIRKIAKRFGCVKCGEGMESRKKAPKRVTKFMNGLVNFETRKAVIVFELRQKRHKTCEIVAHFRYGCLEKNVPTTQRSMTKRGLYRKNISQQQSQDLMALGSIFGLIKQGPSLLFAT